MGRASTSWSERGNKQKCTYTVKLLTGVKHAKLTQVCVIGQAEGVGPPSHTAGTLCIVAKYQIFLIFRPFCA